MVSVPAGKHLRVGYRNLRTLLSLDQDIQSVHVPLADALSNLNIPFTKNKYINITFWFLKQDSLGNVVEERASKAIFSLKREEIHKSTQFSLTVKNVNFRLHSTP